MLRVLIPDAQFDEPDLERRAMGPEVEFDIHRACTPDAIPDSAWRGCDAIVMWHQMRLTAPVVRKLEKCRIIVRCGVGFDNIDVAACSNRGIPVCNVPNYGTTEVADHAIALMLALTRGIIGYQERVKADPARGFRFDVVPLVRRIRSRGLGVVGLGRIGIATARRARALDMEVLFYDPYLSEGTDLAHGLSRADSLRELLAASDVVSLHTPLTEETRNMIGPEAIASMKDDAILINTSRGGVVDLDALYDGLRSGKIAGAGLDVLPQEPPDPSHPLLKAWCAEEPWLHGRLIITPHAAFFSAEGFEDLRRLGAETAILYLRDGRLRSNVNPEFRHDRR